MRPRCGRACPRGYPPTVIAGRTPKSYFSFNQSGRKRCDDPFGASEQSSLAPVGSGYAATPKITRSRQRHQPKNMQVVSIALIRSIYPTRR